MHCFAPTSKNFSHLHTKRAIILSSGERAPVNIQWIHQLLLPTNQGMLLPDEHPDTCVIAIGLFRDPRNVARLVKKIEDAGLEPYSKTESGQTRVGVRFPYTEDAEIAGHLALVQSKLEPSAFVLLK
jgi:hypothetical protein